jgi:site-specific DNA recombinase
MITLPPGTRAACWVRVSSDGQVRDESPAVHLQRTQEYCELQGWPVVEVYKLDAVSGASVMDHPETKRMLRDVEAGRIDALVFSAVARVGRDLLELLTIEKHLRTHGARLVSTRRGVIDTSTPEGMSSFVNEGARAQDERLELSARVRAGLKQRAKMGQFTAAVAPYGYRKAPGPQGGRSRTLEIDPIEGPVRALMYDLYLQHQRLMRVATELNKRGYRNRNGRPFARLHIKQILLESSASGVYYSNKTLKPGTLKPESEWIAIPVPALIEPEKWQRCRDLLIANGRVFRKAVYAYSGLMVCSCGRKMYVRAPMNYRLPERRDPPSYFCRSCGNKIKLSDLDEAIGRAFTGFLLDGLPDDAEQEQNQIERQLNGLHSELKQVLRAKKRWAEAYQAGALSLDEFTGYHAPLVERERAIGAEISRIEADQRTDKQQLEAQARAAEILQLVQWSDLQTDEKQALLREFVHEIRLGVSDVRIRLFYTPAALQLAKPGLAQTHIITITRPDYVESPAGRLSWARRIHQTRIARGESVECAAKKLGVDADILRRWEAGRKTLWPGYIPAIIVYLGFVPWDRTPYAQASPLEALRAAREIAGLSQSELARQLGVSQSHISELERGDKDRPGLLDRIESLIGVDVRRIFSSYHQG